MIKIATWNMCYWQHRKSLQNSWNYLSAEINPDIVLVQETVPPPTLLNLENYVWDEIGGNRKWGSGIFSKHPIERVEFDNNHQGSVIAGEVTLPSEVKLTAISIHVLLEHGYSIIPLHRIFSDLTLLLEEKRGKRHIMLGGDFNASLQFDKHQPGESHRILFERVENFGLVNCLKKFYDHPVQTYRHNKDDKPWQLDYLFLSSQLENKLEKCYVLESPDILALSDHNPVVAHLSL